ncbi:MAG: toxin-antitoxin system HicB family antitoxin [Anaerolineales bacterium]|nr:toxin-antitoxin system HicB family antitoxin [Anaerolineales bacterium]
MGTLSIRIPDYLHKGLRELADKEGISINQLITLAIAEKLSALATEDYIAQRAAKGSRAKYEAVLAKVPDVEPLELDR